MVSIHTNWGRLHDELSPPQTPQSSILKSEFNRKSQPTDYNVVRTKIGYRKCVVTTKVIESKRFFWAIN